MTARDNGDYIGDIMPKPVILTLRDNGNSIRALVESYCTTINTGWGGSS